MSVAVNLKRYMVACDMTTTELADASGVSKASIGAYLKGHTKPAPAVLSKLADALGCTVDALDKPAKVRQRGTNVPIATAAAIMGKEPQWLRLMLQRGLLPFGQAIKNEGSTKYNYYINQADFERYTGVTVEGRTTI